MKRIFISAGLVAAGAAGLQSACAANLDVISPKAWNISGTLRGFYDDNYSISSTKQGSAGIEVSPEISFNVPLQQTDLGVRYIYGLYYYQQRQDLGVNAFDQSHQLDLWFDHSFSERWKLKVTDSFAVGQEPELLQPNQSAGTLPFRVEGDNIANHALVSLDTDWTRLFSTSLSYGNNYYDYQQSGSSVSSIAITPTAQTPVISKPGTAGWQTVTSGNPPAGGPSLAGTLNRIEQNIALDLQWHLQPETMVFLGYNFSIANYIGNEAIAVANYANPVAHQYQSIVYQSDSRDSVTHYGYVGVQHQFTANLSGKASLGASFTDNYNDPLNPSTTVAPYADINVSYTYTPGSYIQLGFTQDQNATDVASVGSNGSLTDYQQSSVIYFDINHRITPKLLATAVTRYQYSVYQGGAANNQADGDFGLSLNLSYQINQHFSCEAGYNYDNLTSDVAGRAYSRNRVYIGLGANY